MVFRPWIRVAALGIAAFGLATAPGASAQGPGRTVIGEEIPVVLESAHPHARAAGATPELVWSETLDHPSATYIAVHFERFDLAPGDWVVVRAPDGGQARRYEGLGRAGLGRSAEGFWAVHVKGEAAVVELWSAGGEPGWGVRIDSFARGLTQQEIYIANPGLGEPGPEPGPEAICGTDNSQWAPCFADTEPEIYAAARATIRLMINGTSACTAWLVGCEGHLITNNHCISTQTTASNTDYEFAAEGASCATSCASWGACPGVIEADAGTLVRTNGPLDYTLIQLPVNVTPTYGFLKLRASGPAIDERIYVPQHPAAWGKRVAVLSTAAQDASGFCEVHSLSQPPCTGGPGDVGYYCDTQGGSSGSPVLAYSDHRVVSLHHCANCPNRGLNIADVIESLGDDLPACAAQQLAGEIELSRHIATCSETLSVTVRDDSIAGNGWVDVAAWSGSEGAETLTLTEQGAGTFVGPLVLAAAPPAGGDGLLAVGHGELVTVQYIDADDGQGGVDVPRQASVDIDCLAPQILAVQAGALTGSTALVSWTTDEPATSSVTWGLLPPGSGSVTSPALVTDHAVALSGLSECTTHFFSVASTDEAGNTGSDTNQGSAYPFTTVIDSNATLPSDDTPVAIPDGSADGVSSTIAIPHDRSVIEATVTVQVDHNFVGDLGLSLRAPTGQSVLLSRFRGGSGDDYAGTLFDDDATTPIANGSAPFAGSYIPERPLSDLDGIDALGDWSLRVIDRTSGTSGTLLDWQLALTFPPESCPPVPAGPPPVGDGTAGSEPLRASRLDAAGTELAVSWDPGCETADTKLIWGQLETVSSWMADGAVCSATTPLTWSGAPPGSVWFLAIHEAAGVEGSWGQATSGERHGIAPSGLCAATAKELSADCP